MAQKKKTFESRIEEAKEYVEKGEIKKAVSTLKKAIEKEPEKDVDKKIETWIVELEIELAKPVEEEVEKVQDTKEFKEGVAKVSDEEVIPETIVDPTDDIDDEKETEIEVVAAEEEKPELEKEEEVLTEEDLEEVNFIVTAPFLRGGTPYEVGDIVKLTRKNDFVHIKEHK